MKKASLEGQDYSSWPMLVPDVLPTFCILSFS